METINKKNPWDFFDGASQNQPYGVLETLYLSETHQFQIQMGIVSGKNNHAGLFISKTAALLHTSK